MDNKKEPGILETNVNELLDFIKLKGLAEELEDSQKSN